MSQLVNSHYSTLAANNLKVCPCTKAWEGRCQAAEALSMEKISSRGAWAGRPWPLVKACAGLRAQRPAEELEKASSVSHTPLCNLESSDTRKAWLTGGNYFSPVGRAQVSTGWVLIARAVLFWVAHRGCLNAVGEISSLDSVQSVGRQAGSKAPGLILSFTCATYWVTSGKLPSLNGSFLLWKMMILRVPVSWSC